MGIFIGVYRGVPLNRQFRKGRHKDTTRKLGKMRENGHFVGWELPKVLRPDGSQVLNTCWPHQASLKSCPFVETPLMSEEKVLAEELGGFTKVQPSEITGRKGHYRSWRQKWLIKWCIKGSIWLCVEQKSFTGGKAVWQQRKQEVAALIKSEVISA